MPAKASQSGIKASSKVEVKSALKDFAFRRQWKPEPEVIELYAEDLQSYFIQHIREALSEIAREPMGQYDKPMPPIANIIEFVEKARRRSQTGSVIRIWHCTACDAVQGSPEPNSCHSCGGIEAREQKPIRVIDLMTFRRLPEWEQARYVSFAEVAEEAAANVAKRRAM